MTETPQMLVSNPPPDGCRSVTVINDRSPTSTQVIGPGPMGRMTLMSQRRNGQRCLKGTGRR